MHLFARALAAAVAVASLSVPWERATAQQAVDLDALPRLRLVEELRIGSRTDPNIGFTSIQGVDVDRDGQVYVWEQRDATIRVYSPTGQLVRTIGRRGQGPGEFTGNPGTRMGVVGDTVWVAERSKPNVMLFARDGRFLAEVEPQAVWIRFRAGQVRGLSVYAMRANGTLVSFLESAPAAPIGTIESVEYPLVLWSAAGALIDTVGTDQTIWGVLAPPARVNLPGNVQACSESVCRELTSSGVPVAPTNDPVRVPFREGSFVIERPLPNGAARDAIRVVRLALNGDTAFSREFGYLPQRYAASMLDSIASRKAREFLGTLAVYTPPVFDVSPVRAAMDFPSFLPAVQGTFVTADNGVWLRRAEDFSGVRQWAMLDSLGRGTGRIETPSRRNSYLTPMWSQGNVLWAVSSDADDVPWLIRYRIAP